MALIGIYSDPHIGYTSSILPLYSDTGKYTTRLSMILDTYKWMYKVFEENHVDLIFNGGDTCDKNILRSEEITALSDAYSYSKGTREVSILGNHEILDINRNYSSVATLKNYPFIDIYTDPCIVSNIKLDDGTSIAVLPYMKADDVTADLLKSIKADILLSHIDIRGSHLRIDYTADTGVDPELLAEYFGLVINGHIHTYEVIPSSKNKVINIGSCTSGSFSDDNHYIPGIAIYDTVTKQFKRFDNPYAILFRRMSVSSLSDLMSKIKQYNNGYKYSFRITAPYDIADDIRNYISKLDYVVAYRVVGDVSKMKLRTEMFSPGKIDGIDDTALEFKKYIRSGSVPLNHPIEDYIQFIDSLE